MACPRCGKEWIVPQGNPDIECWCHLYCEYGEKPSDCNVTYPLNWSGEFNWPRGLKTNATDNSDFKHRATGYCSTHSKYIYNDMVIIDCDWKEWYSHRADKKYTMSNGEF